MYSIKDFHIAEKNYKEANENLLLKIEEQEDTRSQIDALLNKLDSEIAPYKNKLFETETILNDMKSRLLGSWIDESGHSAIILKYGGTDKCWDKRVWLRIVSRETPQWEADIDLPNTRRVFVKLGPANFSNKHQELQENKRIIESKLQEFGYILDI